MTEVGAAVDRLARVGGALVPGALVALASVHAAWALGWRWPGGSDREFAEHLLSRAERERLVERTGSEVPPASATWAVALALLTAAGIVRMAATSTRSRAVRPAAWGVSGVFLARGAAGIASDLMGGLDERYKRLDLAIYSPLCIALSAGTAGVARQARVDGNAATVLGRR